MNIIILSSSKRQSGGVERFSFYLENCLTKQGHAVTILGREDLTSTEVFIMKLKKLTGMEHPALGYFLGRKAMKLGFDVCVTNGMLGWNIKNKKVINIQHGTFARAADRVDRHQNIFKFFIKKYIWGFFEQLAGRRAGKCVAVSNEVKESVEQYYGVKNVAVIPNATDTNFFKPLDRVMCRGKMKLPIDKKIAIFVGRFEYAKGKNILEGLQKYMHEIGGEFIIAEHYSQEELVWLYNASDVFLLPSLQEGCSYALLDAMACGLPFLASPVGLVSEFLMGKMFIDCVVEEQTISTYIKKLEILFELPESQKSKLSEDLREYILKEHSIPKFSDAYGNLVRELGSK